MAASAGERDREWGLKRERLIIEKEEIRRTKTSERKGESERGDAR